MSGRRSDDSSSRFCSVGRSGTWRGAHLRFRVTDSPSVVVANGLPYVLARDDITGRTPPLEEVLPWYEALEPIPVAADGMGSRRDPLPLGRDVLAFPDAATGMSYGTPWRWRIPSATAR
jgi:hypothetical protein